MITTTRVFPRPLIAVSRASNGSVKQELHTKISNCKWFVALVAIAISFLNANVQAQTAQWIKQQGTGGISNGVSSDALQNTYATGMVSNPGLFDNLTIPCNASDVFVAKYEPTGGLIWAKTAGGPLLDQGYDIATDTTGNSYVVGAIQTNGIYPTVTFDAITLTGHGDYDWFIAKYDANGSVVWAKNAGPGFIRVVPVNSQIGITDGAASYSDGFPPDNFIPEGSGGVPPFGQDFNGLCQAITQWLQFDQAGGPITYDASFAASIGGYPKGALLTAASLGSFWLSLIDNNLSNPDLGGSNWLGFSPGGSLFAVATGTASDLVATINPAPASFASLTGRPIAAFADAPAKAPNAAMKKRACSNHIRQVPPWRGGARRVRP